MKADSTVALDMMKTFARTLALPEPNVRAGYSEALATGSSSSRFP